MEPELLRALLEAGPRDHLRVIVHLRDQADLESGVAVLQDVVETRVRVVSALKAHAARSQVSLRAYLEEAQAAGTVESYTPFWIFNGVAVRAHPAVIRALAARPDVAAVRLDRWQRWISGPAPVHVQPQTSAVEWNVARVRADQVWAALRITGTGAVVAGMDTGADWFHPALQANYRAYNPHGPSNHLYSWYDATGSGALYPVDGHGHGSHTLGSAVGGGGIGVAPGAQWIAVRVLNSQGMGYDSWIHAGFQWILAPGGDPNQAPGVVNCSWGNKNGSLVTFQPDLRALRAGGIFVVFSAGNEGPARGTVGSPASLPQAFAVGATDFDDEVANFSSRGPSPWGEVRPHVTAPGVGVRSSLPGGAYGAANGTSMAAPHVTGLVALLRSVSPTLTITRVAFILTSTAVPVGDPVPNYDAGWGRIDALAAVAGLSRSGLLTGTVTRAGDQIPIAGARIAAVPRGGGGGGQVVTGDDGSYLLALAPTMYDLTVSAFGYQSATVWGVEVVTETTRVMNFALTPLPTGLLRVRVAEAGTGVPVTATISVSDTPLVATASAYTFTLPAGTYVLRARSLGYRVVTTTVTVEAAEVTTADLALSPVLSILLVDSGRWYYDSQVGYFRQALDDLAYAYDEWAIKHLPADLPTSSDLIPYDAVVWSAPLDAPGYIGAQDAIAGYLAAGGRLLLSGQDVGFWDGGGALGYWSSYYRDYLKARYVRDDAPSRVLEGLEGGIFAGLTITITGPGGADNQRYPDEVTTADPDAATATLAYLEAGCGGLQVGTCLDYRAVYLAFGFEAINDRVARREVMKRALDWLASPSPTVGLELTPPSQMLVGPPGSIVTHTVRVRHVGQGGVTDTISLSLSDGSWVTQLSTSSLSLSPCTSDTVVVTVTVPLTAGWDVRDVITLTARSSLSPTLARMTTLVTKAPAPVLLVDDERWYNYEDRYEEALADGGFYYDYWRTGYVGGEPMLGSPPLVVLQRYPIVVWWTGYDWYKPVTLEEEAALATYLDGGGRLFFSSQDFLYHHFDAPFRREYLGVMNYTEDVTPTLASGVSADAVGDRLGPYPLSYPFLNWSDALVPAPGTAVSFREEERRPIALSRQGDSYRTVFFSFPFETLPETGRAEVMERVVGWLSWLGRSAFLVDREAVIPGDTLTYTLRIQNDGPGAVTAALSNTLPGGLIFAPGSLTGPGSYDSFNHRLLWSGPLAPGQVVTFTYRATVVTGTALGAPIVNTARFTLEDHHISFHRAAVVRVGTPDLSPSSFRCDPIPVRTGAVITCTLALVNAAPSDAPLATVTNLLPAGTYLFPDSPWISAGTARVLTGTIRWTGPLTAGSGITLAYRLAVPINPIYLYLYNVAFLEDGMGGTWERSLWIAMDPLRSYLPLVLRE